MGNKKQLSPEEKTLYFDLQADFGLTKHMGGLRATKELIELCHIGKDSHVLEVGCGVGITTSYIAQKIGSRVVGVDVSEGMIKRAKERARRFGVEDRVEFRVADAQSLPFEDNLFEAVVSESVLAFVGDKKKAISEYKRVTKPGGYVGLNEAIWLKTPPKELVEYISRIAKAEFPTSDEWKELLESAGLKDLVAKTYKINMLNEMAEQTRRLDLREYLQAWYRFLLGCIKNPLYRKFAKNALFAPRSILQFLKYVGYGIYVGRK